MLPVCLPRSSSRPSRRSTRPPSATPSSRSRCSAIRRDSWAGTSAASFPDLGVMLGNLRGHRHGRRTSMTPAVARTPRLGRRADAAPVGGGRVRPPSRRCWCSRTSRRAIRTPATVVRRRDGQHPVTALSECPRREPVTAPSECARRERVCAPRARLAHALGAIGLVTDGGIRDLAGVRERWGSSTSPTGHDAGARPLPGGRDHP